MVYLAFAPIAQILLIANITIQASAVATLAPAAALDVTAKGAAAVGAQEVTAEVEVRLIM